MDAIPELPQNLWSIRDAAIDSIINGTKAPNLQPIYDWLEDDGWDAIVGAWSNEEMAIKLEDLAETAFDDEELAYDLDMDVKDITDEMRITRTRELINESLDDGYESPSVHSYKLLPESDESPVIGCVMEIHGQGGAVADWWGVYKNHDDFIKSIRASGLILLSELDALTDEKILSLWQG